MHEKKIRTVDDIIAATEEYGFLTFWDAEKTAASTLSAIDFNTLWDLREQAVNSHRVAYGKYFRKKMTFVSLELFPHLCALRRDGYDFDSLADEGKAPRREILVMDAVNADPAPVPSYALGKSLAIKGFDAAVASLQNKTYLCVTFKKSAMGTALLDTPEDIFGSELVRSAYGLSNAQNAEILSKAKVFKEYSDEEIKKALTPAV
ncbi:MAG: hypothetical protein HFJ21_01490 [Clostridia bacterium]|nr:hypothetical protein [Clostridia bacterium]